MSFSKLVDQSLTSSDFTVMLELSDMIKSKQASPSAVLSEINNKLSNTNISTATVLLDCLIKNSGPSFISELSNFNNIFAFLAEYIQSNPNTELKKYLLEWAHLLKTHNPYIFDLFIRLKYNNIDFPKYTANEILLECSLAPDWVDSSSCMICDNSFNLINRKHHCRNCGKCVCNSCSQNKQTIPKYGIMDTVRVCNNCYNPSGLPNSSGSNFKALELSDDQEQRELELAIKESLKLTNSHQNQRFEPKEKQEEIPDEEQEMIRKAIELSLKDDNLQKQSANIKKNIYKEFQPNLNIPNMNVGSTSSQYNSQFNQPYQQSPSPTPSSQFQQFPPQSLDVTATEMQSLDLFYAW
eukprot:NODE_161_length_14984_cov_0.487000.p4 type:complete len:353 gc:universal NODE_161_length_14984_cov_0.487000:12686-13744(+)